MSTSKRTRLSAMLDGGTKNTNNERQGTGSGLERPSDRCSGHGCPLRADICTSSSEGGRGTCKFHYRARALARDQSDVTTRIRNRIDLIKQVERLANAPLELIDGAIPKRYRALARITGEHGTSWTSATYPSEITLGQNESHPDWIDRANEQLNEEIVVRAKPNPFA